MSPGTLDLEPWGFLSSVLGWEDCFSNSTVMQGPVGRFPGAPSLDTSQGCLNVLGPRLPGGHRARELVGTIPGLGWLSPQPSTPVYE